MECIAEFYPESDDSYLMMDAITKDLAEIPFSTGRGLVSVEIGPGSGVVSKHFLEVSSKLQLPVFHLAVDVNAHAACETRRVSDTECVIGDIFSCFRPDVKFDVIFSNPPYVPSSPINGSRCIRASYAGGEFGREFIDRFLPLASDRLSVDVGRFYFLLEKRNNVEQVCQQIFFPHCELLLDRRIPGEHLYVFKFFK